MPTDPRANNTRKCSKDNVCDAFCLRFRGTRAPSTSTPAHELEDLAARPATQSNPASGDGLVSTVPASLHGHNRPVSNVPPSVDSPHPTDDISPRQFCSYHAPPSETRSAALSRLQAHNGSGPSAPVSEDPTVESEAPPSVGSEEAMKKVTPRFIEGVESWKKDVGSQPPSPVRTISDSGEEGKGALKETPGGGGSSSASTIEEDWRAYKAARSDGFVIPEQNKQGTGSFLPPTQNTGGPRTYTFSLNPADYTTSARVQFEEDKREEAVIAEGQNAAGGSKESHA